MAGLFGLFFATVSKKFPQLTSFIKKTAKRKRNQAVLPNQNRSPKKRTTKQQYIYQVGMAAIMLFVVTSLNTHPGVFERAGALSHAGYFVNPDDLKLSFEELVANQEYGYLVSIGSATQSSLAQSANRTEDTEHVVKPGEDLTSIARWYGLEEAKTIMWANGLDSATIRPGMRLLIPAKDGYTYKVRSGDSIASIAQMFQVDEQAILEYNKINGSSIFASQQLFIPGAVTTTEVLIAATTQPEVAAQVATAPTRVASPTIDIPELQPAGPPINPVETPEPATGVSISDPLAAPATSVTTPPPTPQPRTEPDAPIITVTETQPPVITSDPIVTSQGWVYPTPDSCTITQRYHRGHLAVDCANRSGGRIVASKDGVVETSTCSRNGYGCYVVIDHNNGFKTLYAHFRDAPMVAVGQSVASGQQIGWMGTTGWSTGVHIHFELVQNGVKISPIGPVF